MLTAFFKDVRQLKPLQAWRAMRALIADPENTAEVFRIIEALKGDTLGRALQRLQATPEGCALLRDRPDILSVLNDRARLRAMPDGSLGRAYLRFVEEQDLSADGLVAASEEAPRHVDKSAEERWLGNRLRDIHDLQHVLCGYGRDELGELCLLAFMAAQTPNRGIAFIVFMGRRQFRRNAPHIDVDACVEEGRRIGEQAGWFVTQRWEERLGEPLQALRAELNVGYPQCYRQALAVPESSAAVHYSS